jgi:hypothetical protein
MPDPSTPTGAGLARALGSSALRQLLILALAVSILPLAGALLSDAPLGDLLSFPLTERAWDQAPADDQVTALANGTTLLLLASLLWLIWPRRMRRVIGAIGPVHDGARNGGRQQQRWPRYGWLSPLFLLAALIALDGAASNAAIGLVTLGLTLLVNADTERRTGQSLISQRRGYFLALFPLSVAAGWLCLYWPNLFLGLWTYPPANEPIPFALGKSLDYATLLPALMSLRQWLASFPWLLRLSSAGRPLASTDRTIEARAIGTEEGWLLIAAACLVLAAGPIWPDVLFPFFVAAPAILTLGIQIARQRSTSLAGIAAGDWSRPLLSSLAALLIMAIGQSLNLLLGGAWVYQLPLLAGPMVLGLPAVAWSVAIPLALLGLWLADQLSEPFRQRPQPPPFRPRSPLQVPLVDLLKTKNGR